jgi:hypothetical protein
MRILAVVALTLSGSWATAGTFQVWLEEAPRSLGASGGWEQIPGAAFFEIPVSKFAAAEGFLASVAFLAQEDSAGTHFGRPDFKCTMTSKPYLVRASYMQGATGRFSVYWAGSALVVEHASFGLGGTHRRSALLVCLPKAPTAVFSRIFGAM